MNILNRFKPVLDPDFLSAVCWNLACQATVQAPTGSVSLSVVLVRPVDTCTHCITSILSFSRETKMSCCWAGSPAGSLLLKAAERVLALEFPTLNEKDKRHGQAVAAASLPMTGENS